MLQAKHNLSLTHYVHCKSLNFTKWCWCLVYF